MRNWSVISKSPNGSRVRNSRAIKIASPIHLGTIKPATKTVIDAHNVDIRTRLYNPQAAAQIRKLAAENAARNGPFDPVAFDTFVTNHPLFLDLHLVVGEDED